MAKKASTSGVGHHVYILKCGDGTFYTGYARHIQERIKLHNAGRGAKYVRGRLPVRLVYAQCFQTASAAYQEEHRIKKLTRRQKEALIYFS